MTSKLDRLPRTLVRLQGLAVFLAAVGLYLHVGYSVVLLVALVLAPDLSMLGYLAGPRAGAVAYDAVHTSALPIVLGAVGLVAEADLAVQSALIWLAHIGVDRFAGYGLKYPTSFKDTHIGRL